MSDPFGPGGSAQALLSCSLELAVPMWLERVRAWPWELRRQRAEACAEVIAHQGDKILFRTPARPAGRGAYDQVGTAAAFNRLAESLALLACQPGGVSFLGRHWEAEQP